jgi:hypothetical protein
MKRSRKEILFENSPVGDAVDDFAGLEVSSVLVVAQVFSSRRSPWAYLLVSILSIVEGGTTPPSPLFLEAYEAEWEIGWSSMTSIAAGSTAYPGLRDTNRPGGEAWRYRDGCCVMILFVSGSIASASSLSTIPRRFREMLLDPD